MKTKNLKMPLALKQIKLNRLHTGWIVLVSSAMTAHTSLLAIGNQLIGTLNRKKADDIIQKWINRLLDLIGVTCQIINPHQVEPETGKPTIIMCNHTSLYDIPISYKVFPQHSMRMLAKKELSRVPLMGRAMKAAKFPFVDRKRKQQAIKDLAYAKSLMENEGIILWVAPEGTRSSDGKLKPFKKGGFITAIHANATIIPIGIRGAHEILPARTFRLNLNKTAEIHVGRAFDTTKYAMENKLALIQDVFEEMEKLVHPNS